MTEPEQIKLKRKYTSNKHVGRFRGSHNDGTRRKAPARKGTGKGSGKFQESNMILHLMPNGKLRLQRKE